jgi:hypothetical protein
MARVVLILVVCTFLMFIVVLQTPPQFVKAVLSGYVTFPDESPDDIEEEETKPATKPARKASTTATSPARRSVTVSSEPEVASKTTQVQPEIPSSTPVPEQAGPYVLRVAADGTALYSLNSTDGDVVGVLRKGEIVEPQLEINDSGQTWAFVNVAGQRMSGFLQKDSLERQRAGQTIQ